LAGIVMWVLVRRYASEDDEEGDPGNTSGPHSMGVSGPGPAAAVPPADASVSKYRPYTPLTNSWVTPTGSQEGQGRSTITTTDGGKTYTRAATPESHQELTSTPKSARQNKRSPLDGLGTPRSPRSPGHLQLVTPTQIRTSLVLTPKP
jgi:hypothetical protein